LARARQQREAEVVVHRREGSGVRGEPGRCPGQTTARRSRRPPLPLAPDRFPLPSCPRPWCERQLPCCRRPPPCPPSRLSDTPPRVPSMTTRTRLLAALLAAVWFLNGRAAAEEAALPKPADIQAITVHPAKVTLK